MLWAVNGLELKEQRNQLGVTQAQLAGLLDVTVYSIARWEQLKDAEIPNSRMIELALRQLFTERGLWHDHK